MNNFKKHHVIEYIECEIFFFKNSGKKGKGDISYQVI